VAARGKIESSTRATQEGVLDARSVWNGKERVEPKLSSCNSPSFTGLD